MDSIYSVLLQLPFFQGITRAKMAEIIEKTRFHFLKYQTGETVALRGEECSHLKFIVSGSVQSELLNSSGKICISETLSAPNVLFPNYLFGRNTTYPGKITAKDNCGIMQIDKQSFISLIQQSPIFIINLLNILSRYSQKSLESFLAISSGSVKERLAFWILSSTQRNATDIQINGKLKDIYTFLKVQRAVFMAALNELSEEGTIIYSPQSIQLLDRQKLRDILFPSAEA
ncbi:MAG: Crp/Fnr family transcriptional regulator [Porphyromonadaceae bacterium]|nr:Crp/Fnr family transcriptional regulator [Porphyromonadaceae bacterium]